MENTNTANIRLGVFFDIANIQYALMYHHKERKFIPLSHIRFSTLLALVSRGVTPKKSFACYGQSDPTHNGDFVSHLKDARITPVVKVIPPNGTNPKKGNCDVEVASLLTGAVYEHALNRIVIVSGDADFLGVVRNFRTHLCPKPEFEFHYFNTTCSTVIKRDKDIQAFNLSLKLPDLITGYNPEYMDIDADASQQLSCH